MGALLSLTTVCARHAPQTRLTYLSERVALPPMTDFTFDLEHLAQLARLELDADQQARLAPQLASILEYVSRLEQLDTHGIPSTYQVTPQHNVFRSDTVQDGLSTEQALANAPACDGPYFLMPRILE